MLEKTLEKTKIRNMSVEDKQVSLCKLNLKRKGLDDKRIELLERNIRAIINNILDDLEYE
jgi:hypothetical protein